jgi:outer membrane protein assembly factor BamB
MSRIAAAAMLACAVLCGCGVFSGNKKQPLPGERISVLSLEGQLKPDPAIARIPITLPKPAVDPDWPQPGGNPDHEMEHPALPATLQTAWTTGLGAGSSRYTQILSQPIVAGGRVFAMDGGSQVGAYDTATGREIWRVDVRPDGDNGNGFGGGVAYWKGRLYVTSGFARVLALDPQTGKVIWKTRVSGPIHSGPTVVDARLYAVTVDNELVVLDTKDGSKIWSHDGIPESASLIGSDSPAVQGEAVVVGYSSGEIYALTVENGRALWSDNLASVGAVDAVSALADIRGRPVIDRDRVFAVSHGGRMAAIDLRTGERIWETDIGSTHGPWVAGDFVYVLSNDNTLVCLTRDNGKVRWLRPLPAYENEQKKEGPIVWAGPILGGDRLIVVSSNGWVASVSPYTGEVLSRQQIPGSVYVDPIIAGDTLYISTDNGQLVALR